MASGSIKANPGSYKSETSQSCDCGDVRLHSVGIKRARRELASVEYYAKVHSLYEGQRDAQRVGFILLPHKIHVALTVTVAPFH